MPMETPVPETHLRRAVAAARKGHWPAAAAVDSVTLDYAERYRRRIRLATDAEDAILLDLAEAVGLRDGDGLRLVGGGWIAVRAACEPLIEIVCADPGALIRVAWHLGNRHLAVQIAPDRLVIRDDHVIAAMVEGLGATARRISAPFEPEGGAYAADHDHG